MALSDLASVAIIVQGVLFVISNGYFEASFAEHVTEIIVRQAKKADHS